ncbi:MAG: hypothetical protein ACE5KK_07905 [Candidatus Brocadiales bacterium]
MCIEMVGARQTGRYLAGIGLYACNAESGSAFGTTYGMRLGEGEIRPIRLHHLHHVPGIYP